MQKIKAFFENLTLETLIPALIVLVAGALIIRLILRLYDTASRKSNMEKAARGFIRSLLRILLWILLVIILLTSLGVGLGSIVAVLSVVSLAISLAVQNELANVVSGMTVLITRPFKAGDYVQIAGQTGTVQDVRIFYTCIVTSDNRYVSIPNSNVTATEIVNFSALGKRRLEIKVAVSYDSPPELVRSTLLALANQPQALLTPAPIAFIDDYGDSAITYTLQVWVKAEDYLSMRICITDQIHEAFRQAGIELTYPHLNVHIQNEETRKEEP